MCTTATAAAGNNSQLRFSLFQGLVSVFVESRSRVLAMPGGPYFMSLIYDTQLNMPSMNLVKSCM
jgi:hypothetical protein